MVVTTCETQGHTCSESEQELEDLKSDYSSASAVQTTPHYNIPASQCTSSPWPTQSLWTATQHVGPMLLDANHHSKQRPLSTTTRGACRRSCSPQSNRRPRLTSRQSADEFRLGGFPLRMFGGCVTLLLAPLSRLQACCRRRR